MILKESDIICFVVVASVGFDVINGGEVKLDQNKPAAAPASRFFDLGGYFNQLFPGFNHETPGGFAGNPGGIGFPANSQFYPPAVPQDKTPRVPSDQKLPYPVIDDAKQYPIQHGSNPSQGNFGGNPVNQYPDEQQPEYPNQGGFGGPKQPQYPDQGDFGGPEQPDYPNQGGFGVPKQPEYPNQGGFGGPKQPEYPNQGDFGGPKRPKYPNQGGFGGPNYPEYPSQGDFGGPKSPEYANQGGFDGPKQPESPNQGGFGGPQRPGYPNQGDINGSPQINDGTLNGMMPAQPPTGGPSNSDPNQQGNGNTVAILGRPVVVAPPTFDPNQIVFPNNSTEGSSRQKQCVQDCETTSEYNPVCGSNNVTYFNPGRFVCARNCGVNVFVRKQGRCVGVNL